MWTDLKGVTFLLGSGVSIPSGYPSTAQITQALLTKDWLFDREQSQSEILLTSMLYGRNHSLRMDAIFGLIRLLRSQVDQHLALQGKSEPTYEDVYYMARQLLDGLHDEYDNPGLLPFLSELRSKATLMVDNLNAAYGLDGILRSQEQLGLTGLLQDCVDFIEEAVTAQLVLPKKKKGLKLLDQAVASDLKNPLHIVTLNHDTLLETHFSKRKVTDGFVPWSNAVAAFDPQCFEDKTKHRIRLLKLHGSIDWFRYKARDGSALVLRVRSGDRNHLKDLHGEVLRPPTGRLLLSGTTNKELAYGSGVFLELMFQFHKRLQETDLLIVSGYGFADKGINNRIWAWLDLRPKNRIIVMHNQIDELRRNAKPSFRHNMDRMKDKRKFILVDRWMCDSTLADLQRELRISSR